MTEKKGSKRLKPAMQFILMMGVVSMFSDMTHEGARSIYGAYLNFLGASAATIGFAAGLGELLGYSFRLLAGFITDRRKNYWTMTFVGYAINMLAIPALALVSPDGWMIACALIVFERMGKAIRYPAKNTLVSFAASQVGAGKSFAIQEFLDQLGAFLGPVILFLVMSRRQGSDLYRTYVICFAVLGVPALLTLLALFVARQRFPRPEKMDVSVDAGGRLIMKKSFLLYMAAISFLAVGFADFPLITMHIARQNMIPTSSLPLLYAAAMIADAFSALFFGWLYDRKGIRVLMLSSALSAAFTVFIFAMNSEPAMMTGIILWGIGMGAQESVLKSAVATLVPRDSRSTGFGVFETAFGVCWFLGSWLMGVLYDRAPVWLVVFSVSMQLLAIPLLYASWRRQQKELTEPPVPR